MTVPLDERLLAPTPPFPAVLRLQLIQLTEEMAQVIEAFRRAHGVGEINPFRELTPKAAFTLLQIARLAPMRSPEIKADLGDIGCRLLRISNACRNPRADKEKRGTASGFFSVLSVLSSSLAVVQGESEPPRELAVPDVMKDLDREIRTLLRELKEETPSPSGGWRDASNWAVRLVCNAAYFGDEVSLKAVRGRLKTITDGVRPRLVDGLKHSDIVARWECAQAISWLDALSLIADAFLDQDDVGGSQW